MSKKIKALILITASVLLLCVPHMIHKGADILCRVGILSRVYVTKADSKQAEEESDYSFRVILDGSTYVFRAIDIGEESCIFLPSGISDTDVSFEPDITESDKKKIRIVYDSELPTCIINGKFDLEDLRNNQGLLGDAVMKLYAADGKEIQSAPMRLKGHGNVSFSHDKKSWTIKFDNDMSVLGMNAGNDYVALANAGDDTELRNRITFLFAEDMNMLHTPDSEFVKMYVNDEYMGLYLLAERVEVSGERVNVSPDRLHNSRNNGLIYDERAGLKYMASQAGDIEAADTGVLLREECVRRRYEDMRSSFEINDGRFAELQYPENAAEQVVRETADYYRKVQDAIDSEDGWYREDSETFHWSDVIDQNSHVKKYLLEQITKNKDGNANSSYYYINNLISDRIIYAGPVWDYDIAYGNITSNATYSTPRGVEELNPGLDQHEEFMEDVKVCYESEFRPYFAYRAHDIISVEADRIRNAVYWDRLIWREDYTDETFEDAVSDLNSFIEKRIAFLDEAWINNQTFYRINYVDGTDIIHTEYVKPGESIPEYYPEDDDGRSFLGWFDENGEKPADMNEPVYDDAAVWAKFA